MRSVVLIHISGWSKVCACAFVPILRRAHIAHAVSAACEEDDVEGCATLPDHTVDVYAHNKL